MNHTELVTSIERMAVGQTLDYGKHRIHRYPEGWVLFVGTPKHGYICVHSHTFKTPWGAARRVRELECG